MPTNSYRLRSFTCVGCKRVVTVRRSAKNTKYCTLECYRKSVRPARKKGKLQKCKICTIDFYVSKSRKATYCSRACCTAGQRLTKVHLICIVCLREYLRSPSWTKISVRKFCSISCRERDPSWRKNTNQAANAAQWNKKGPNKLEQAGYALLDKVGVSYVAQYRIGEKFTVDALVGTCLVIQWDGEYWHGHPKTTGFGALSERQKKRRELDKSQNAYCRAAGYTVLRFWETAIKKESEYVLEVIRKAVQETATTSTTTLR